MGQNERTQLLVLKGALSEMPKDEQEAVEQMAIKLRQLLEAGGDMAFLALALVALERQAEL